MKRWLIRYKRWLLFAGALLLLSTGVPLAQLITGGTSGGGSGINSVAVSTPLTGNGVGSPVAIVSPLAVSVGGTGVSVANNFLQLPNFGCGGPSQTHNSGSNLTYLVTVNVPNAVTFSHLGIVAQTGDAANKYDWGLYNSTGTLVADVGASAVPTATYLYLPVVQGTVSILPGQYFEAITGNAATAQFYGCNAVWPVVQYFNFGFASPTTTAGALAATIVPPTFSNTYANSALISFSLMP